MTNDEAIYTLKNTAWLGWDKQKEKVTEAVRMAVEALKTQLPKEDTTSDCISRQEAIRIASGYCHPANIAKELAKLPSVQPVDKDINVSCTDAISRRGAIDICNNVIDLWQGQLGEGALVAIKNAINNLPSVQPEIMPDGTLRITANVDVASIDRILLTQEGTHSGDLYYRDDEKPKRKTGKWINANDGKWNTVEVLKCSVCGEIDNRMYRTDNFCPNCGAKMERGEE